MTSTPGRKDRDLQSPPVFIVPLKLHNVPKGYECYMSCAVTGNPKPRITWYRNHISLNTDTNYYISDTCGVCSLLILRVGPKDMGEYTIMAENALGRAESSTVLSVRGENAQPVQIHHVNRTDGNAPASPNRMKMLTSAQALAGASKSQDGKFTGSVLKLNQTVPLIKHGTETPKFMGTEPIIYPLIITAVATTKK